MSLVVSDLLLLGKLLSLVFTEMSLYLNNEIPNNSAPHCNAWAFAHGTGSPTPAGCPTTSFWRSLPGDKLRAPRLRARPQDCPCPLSVRADHKSPASSVLLTEPLEMGGCNHPLPEIHQSARAAHRTRRKVLLSGSTVSYKRTELRNSQMEDMQGWGEMRRGEGVQSSHVFLLQALPSPQISTCSTWKLSEACPFGILWRPRYGHD